MMKLARNSLLFCSILFFNFCRLEAKPPSFQIETSRDYEILNQFFKMGTEEEEYGYVLDGTKPISIRNFYFPAFVPFSTDLLYTEKELLKTFLVLEAIPLLKKLNEYQKELVLKVSPLSLPGSPNIGVEVQFINVPKLQKVIQDNMALFQYILGPTIQSKQLIDRIAYSEESLFDILLDNPVLTGIVLGFGSYNSLMGGRAELISFLSLSRDTAPFSPQGLMLNDLKECYGWHYLNVAGGNDGLMGFRINYSPLTPLGGFSSIKEEVLAINQIEEELPDCLTQQPRFLFGAYQGGPSNKELFESLKKSQKMTQNLLKENDFLENVLTKILGSQPAIHCKKTDFSNLDFTFFKGRISQEDWKDILLKVSHSFDSDDQRVVFTDTFFNPSNSLIVPDRIGVSQATLKGLKKTLQNLAITKTFFESLAHQSSLQTIVPDQLYFKINEQGTGVILEGFDHIRLSYTITDLNHHILSANYDTWLNVSQLISGLAHGIQGMRVGEKRQIYIHPSFAYGILTTLPPGMGLIANIQLLDIDQKTSRPLLPLNAIDCDWIDHPTLVKELEESIQKKASFMGNFYRHLINKIEGNDSEALLSYLKSKIDNRQSN